MCPKGPRDKWKQELTARKKEELGMGRPKCDNAFVCCFFCLECWKIFLSLCGKTHEKNFFHVTEEEKNFSPSQREERKIANKLNVCCLDACKLCWCVAQSCWRGSQRSCFSRGVRGLKLLKKIFESTENLQDFLLFS
jgi:hypothetical protein